MDATFDQALWLYRHIDVFLHYQRLDGRRCALGGRENRERRPQAAPSHAARAGDRLRWRRQVHVRCPTCPRTGLPLVHLDAQYWRPGWREPAAEVWAATLAGLVQAERWIMDGNYGGSLEQRLRACDTVIFLDRSRWVCLWRVLQRRLRFHGSARPDLTPGCPERLSWSFLGWILSYPHRHRPKILRRLAQLRADQRAVPLRSTREVEQFLRRAQ